MKNVCFHSSSGESKMRSQISNSHAHAGVIAGVFSGVAASIMTVVTTAISPLSSMVGILADLSFETDWFNILLNGSLCCLSWIGIGVTLGALGGLISAVIKSD